MPTFSYEALNPAGKSQKGTIDASNSEEAVQKIKAQGYFPTSVRPQKGKKTAESGDGDTKKKKKKKGGSGFSIGGVGASI